jgi:hypothetical protein
MTPMYVHSLVKVKTNQGAGWRAPVELGEKTPQHVSYTIPLDAGKTPPPQVYVCEVVRVTPGVDRLAAHDLIPAGPNSFILQLEDEASLWFHVRPVSDRMLPYIGGLMHEDFRFPLVEIEPEDPAALDALYEQRGLFIIGCDPSHYDGMSSPLRANERNVVKAERR